MAVNHHFVCTAFLGRKYLVSKETDESRVSEKKRKIRNDGSLVALIEFIQNTCFPSEKSPNPTLKMGHEGPLKSEQRNSWNKLVISSQNLALNFISSKDYP